jgi:hypothetical protein
VLVLPLTIWVLDPLACFPPHWVLAFDHCFSYWTHCHRAFPHFIRYSHFVQPCHPWILTSANPIARRMASPCQRPHLCIKKQAFETNQSYRFIVVITTIYRRFRRPLEGPEIMVIAMLPSYSLRQLPADPVSMLSSCPSWRKIPVGCL